MGAFLILSIILGIIGLVFEERYRSVMDETSLQVGPLIFQSIFFLLMLFTWPDDTGDISFYFILWIICSIVTFIWGGMSVWKAMRDKGESKDIQIKALFSQLTIPAGIAVFIAMIIAVMADSNDRHKKRRR